MESATVFWTARAAWRHRWVVLLMAFVLLAADGALTWESPRSYLARVSLVISPSSAVDPGQMVYSVDALGRSMIVGTYANVLDTDIVRREALAHAGVATDQRAADIEIKAASLADSAVVQVTAVAPDPDLASTVANAVAQVGRMRMGELYPMYDLTVVTPATPPIGLYRPDVKRNLSIGLLLGLVTGVGCACAIEGWRAARRSPPAET